MAFDEPLLQETASDRLARWKRNLLDLSRRNRLINFRDSKKVIPLLCPDIALMEDRLADDKAFQVLPNPDANEEGDSQNYSLPLLADQVDEPSEEEFFLIEMGKFNLYSFLGKRDLTARLIETERAARLALEEGGANTLFLVLGFLIWTESEESEIEHRAPILLIPMAIERKTSREGFRIRKTSDESRINATLLQKLKVDFGILIEGLDPLPEDESGVDVPAVLSIIREAIKGKRGWRVTDEAAIAILTFSRFLMWQDLEVNAKLLKQNSIVAHLVDTPDQSFEDGGSFPDPETLDDKYKPSETFCPLPLDSSQLRAIFAAEEGRTFVLQGPPGTGKSQTIANLIAHCLTAGNGKRVLFVAQKKAALEVVHKRLLDVGFGPFCLELHSNKATRESFRSQLREALAAVGARPVQDWMEETRRLQDLRKKLNEYVKDLHLPRAYGKSAYWIISRLIGNQGKIKIMLALDNIEGKTASDYEVMALAVSELAEAVRITGEPSCHALRVVHLTKWTYGLEDQLQKAINDSAESLQHLNEIANQLMPVLGFDAEKMSFDDIGLAKEFTTLLGESLVVTSSILCLSNWPNAKTELHQWIDLGRDCQATRNSLLETYAEEIFTAPLQDLLEKLHSRDSSWFYKRWRLGAFVRKFLKAIRKDGKRPKDLKLVEEELRTAISVVHDLTKLEESNNLPSSLFGDCWKGLSSNWDDLSCSLEWANRFRSILNKAIIGKEPNISSELCKIWISLATEKRSIFQLDSEVSRLAQNLNGELVKFQELRSQLDMLLSLDSTQAWGKGSDQKFFESNRSMLVNISSNLQSLNDWCHYRDFSARVVDVKLGAIVEALDQGEISGQDILRVFEHSFADWWAREILKTIPSLSWFIGEKHDKAIGDFKSLEGKIAELTKQESFSRIASRLPPMDALGNRAPQSSEMAMLRRFVLGGRKSIRQIFKDCPNAIRRYKPCVLMSPLSVSQFIGPEFPKFDIVVFDEASQLPTYEAIGAIARGTQLIVVGDSRQLPPTTFFERQTNIDDFDEEELPEELESILDEAEAAGIKPLRLDWHYRSRHDSLIAFSNRQYYENKLFVFPAAAAKDPMLGIQWCDVPDGVYDFGRSRTNRKEAERVVQEIVRRLLDPGLQMESIGVVTFSCAQQRLIEDLLDAEREKHPEIEPYLTSVAEPVFVKNLETVQGDERDVILFSICYGPDEAGVIRFNFGPLNNKGGERRLNVAITRARKQLLVFSSIRAEQIDLGRTQAVGVRDLRTFLDYAQRGEMALTSAIVAPQGEVESPFEQSVYDVLIQRSWQVDKQVGCQRYRIDLAVKDPDVPGRYILGIECDGANYHSARSARDRDRIRQMVLEDLGWSLHRIWSTDWWLKRAKEEEKLDEALKLAKIKSDVVQKSVPAERTNVLNNDPETFNADFDASSQNTSRSSNGRRIRSIDEDLDKKSINLPGQSVYRRYKSEGEPPTGDIFHPSSLGRLCDLVAKIVNKEGPILFDSLCSEVASFWGLQRAGNRIRAKVIEAIRRNGLVTQLASGEREFIWTKGMSIQTYETFRVPDEHDPNHRQAKEIPPQEIANAAAQLLACHISMDLDDLARETANLFGIRRLGPNVRIFIDAGIELLKQRDRYRIEGNSIVFT